eukprot:9102630-Alexandrium_andersonii.AAC.1
MLARSPSPLWGFAPPARACFSTPSHGSGWALRGWSLPPGGLRAPRALQGRRKVGRLLRVRLRVACPPFRSMADSWRCGRPSWPKGRRLASLQCLRLPRGL